MKTQSTRAAMVYLHSIGAEQIRIEPGGKHWHLIFRHGGKEHFHILSSSQGDAYFGETKLLADLRRMTTAAREKHVGARRTRKTPPPKPDPVAPAPPPQTAQLNAMDLREALLRHPATDLGALADLAWRAWWRQLMRDVGGESRL